ncbi:hypothetical protein HYE82_01125 [Streptomyces sp. BR123]|uniref:hypothetical protein n=1 Tax=Streptomyces sp. BR123 TaxID=2749828 RepID=UPI0015C42D52|nr:hypothetical protein [Streptomyces sp. BR123]NXY93046.1 hypothetical protein [Streptomyces sp. BR123]
MPPIITSHAKGTAIHEEGIWAFQRQLIIIALIPLALRGVRYEPASAHDLLRRNLAVYGLGGLVLPFVGIKLIDLVVSALPGLG